MLIGERPEDDDSMEWQRRALRAMQELQRMGADAWLEKEMATPSYPDPEWAKFVVDWAAERTKRRRHRKPS